MVLFFYACGKTDLKEEATSKGSEYPKSQQESYLHFEEQRTKRRHYDSLSGNLIYGDLEEGCSSRRCHISFFISLIFTQSRVRME